MRFLWLVLVVLLAGCPARQVKQPPVTKPQDALRDPRGGVALRDDGDLASLRVAIDESLAWLDAVGPERSFVFGPRTVTAAELRAGLVDFRAALADDPAPEVIAARVRARFDVLEATGGEDGDVLFTGYYEPLIEGTLVKDTAHGVPVYGRPPDLVEVNLGAFAERFANERIFGRVDGARLVPYFTRAEIASGKLAGKGLEIAWAKDPIALFFVEVQGSGALQLPDGREVRIGYAASNGRPYKSVGKLLIDEGHVPREQMTMQALRAWLLAHPAELSRVLAYNESYVFFRLLENAPVGSLGRPVTPGRSIATDNRLFPHGALAFIQTERPVGAPDGAVTFAPLTRFVLNQDTGGAIRGAGRVDVFWGRGPDAELSAGMMKQRGRLFFLVPKKK